MRIPSFLVIVLAVDVLAHLYFWLRLCRDPGWPRWGRVGGGLALLVLAVAIPLVRWLAHVAPRSVVAPFEVAAFSWLGVGFFLLVLLLAIDLARLVARGVSKLRAPDDPPVDPERRQLIATGAAAFAGIATTGLSSVALGSGLAEVEVREVGVVLPKLPPALDGLKILQLSDLHVGQSTIGRRFVEQIVDRTLRAKPDLVIITGDLVDGSVEHLADEVAPLARLRARFGVHFVTGNHDYFSGADAWVAHLEKLGVRALRNERVSIGDLASFDLAGIEDFTGARWAGIAGGPDLPRALRGRDPDRAVVLLAHQPKAVLEAAEAGVDLQLSGHTHGGQLVPFNALVGLTQPYVSGLHRHSEATQIYVSRGTGYWGPPMRFLAPAEITQIVLASR